MANFIVTGGCGMIGSNLVKRLVNLNHEVKVIDNLWRGKLENLQDENGKYVIDIEDNFYKIDLSQDKNIDEIFLNTDYVIHLADIVAGIGYVFNNQSYLFRQNLLINSNTLNAVKKTNIKGFIYIGTACSFPEFKQNTYNVYNIREEDLYPAQPESAYGWSKLMGQYETELLSKEYNIKTVSLMLHNVYGAPCDYNVEKSQVIPSLIRKAIRFPEEEFIIWGSGKQGRAFIHVDDVVDGIILAVEKGLGHGVIQLGPSVCTSIKTIAELIKDISNKNLEIHFDLTKPEGDKSRAADYSKAKKILGWEPKVLLQNGLAKTYTWVAEQVSKFN